MIVVEEGLLMKLDLMHTLEMILQLALPIGDCRCQPQTSVHVTDLNSTFAWNQDVTITMALSQAARVTAVACFSTTFPQWALECLIKLN